MGSRRSGPAYPRLEECPDLEVIGKIPWLDSSFLIPELLEQADVVLVGLQADEMRDPGVQGPLLRLAQRSAVIAVVAGPADAELAAQLGIRGLVSRDVEPAAIARVIRAVASGEIAFPRSALGTLLRLVGRVTIPTPGATDIRLTPRQREVVALIAAGATDREVAQRLQISESTAHKHVQNALRRSRARTRSQLVALLRQEPLAS